MSAHVNPEAEEKELVWKFFGQKRDGVFVEVGANDPENLSQTLLLERNGWRGILVEPQSKCCERLRACRPMSKVFQVACGAPEQRGIIGCNLAIWRDDLVRVNGYNEDFTGWGREDSELALRLMNAGIRRLDIRGRALCFHLWHPPASRAGLPANDDLLEKSTREKTVRCEHGLDRHL